MATRGVWRGAISFSLIHIPVSLHTATRSGTLDLDWLDRSDFAPVGYQRINKVTGKPVEWEDIVKAYRHEGDDYVVLTDEDFRLANVAATQTVDVQQFVALHAIPPPYFDTPYHALPEKRGEQVYGLFHSVLARAGLAAIGLVVIRTRQHLCALYANGETLMLNTLRFANELTPPPENDHGNARRRAVTPQDRALAQKLVTDMQADWQPERFHDTYREDLLKRVQAKVKAGQSRSLTEPKAGKAPTARGDNIIDLTQLLRRSLALRAGTEPATARPTPRAAPRVRRTRRSRAPAA